MRPVLVPLHPPVFPGPAGRAAELSSREGGPGCGLQSPPGFLLVFHSQEVLRGRAGERERAHKEELGAGSWSPDASRFAEEFVHFCWFGLRCCLFQLTVAVTESRRWEPSWGGAFPPSLPARGPPAAGADPPRARSPAGRRSAEPRLPATRDPCGRFQITISSPFQITISTRFQITMSSPFQIQFHRPFTPTVPAPRPALRHR